MIAAHGVGSKLAKPGSAGLTHMCCVIELHVLGARTLGVWWPWWNYLLVLGMTAGQLPLVRKSQAGCLCWQKAQESQGGGKYIKVNTKAW